MKRIVVEGQTDCVISLNKIGITVRGKDTAILPISNIDQENELIQLVNANFFKIIEEIDDRPNIQEEPSYPSLNDIEELKINTLEEQEPQKKKAGRPKKTETDPITRRANRAIRIRENKVDRATRIRTKNINELEIKEKEMVDNAVSKTEKRGSKVTLVDKDGVRQGKMVSSLLDKTTSVYNVENNIELTQKSIEEANKLANEEKPDKSIKFIDIDGLTEKNEAKNAFIDNKENNDDDLEPFIEI